MKLLSLGIYSFLLLFTLFVVVYNWLYIKEVIKAKHRIGIDPPSIVRKLLRLNVYIGFLAGSVIVLFIIFDALR